MLKDNNKNKVGRPKLADERTKKDSITSIVISLAIVFTMSIGGLSELTGKTPWQVLTFQNPNKVVASAAESTKTINASKTNSKKITTTKNIKANKSVSTKAQSVRVIPAISVKTIKIK